MRDYFKCSHCTLTFVPDKFYVSAVDEKTVYDLHQNNPDDLGYRQHLNKLFLPLKALLKSNSTGLDFGSGPGPTLSIMFEEIGFSVSLYDLYYAKDENIWLSSYDFITSTEVIEHLHSPVQEIQRLWDCLNPSGYLGLMTLWCVDDTKFDHWHYKRDKTHVCFYSEKSMLWLAHYLKATVILNKSGITILQKSLR
jgi:cyclopropane fatty-acyl-phospholipid synthase-like methyltransferase